MHSIFYSVRFIVVSMCKIYVFVVFEFNENNLNVRLLFVFASIEIAYRK